MNNYSLSVSSITDTSADITLTHDSGNDPVDDEIVIVKQGGTEVSRQTANMPLGQIGETDTLTFTGLTASTAYTVELSSSDGEATPVSFTTKATGYDDPKTATQEQWEDLASKINAKANTSSLSTVATSGSYSDLSNKPTIPTITMTTTDPGEGSALAANNYIAVYGGDPIIMDYSAVEVNTGAKWIDGGAIYKKTINTGALPNIDVKTVNTGITGLSRVIKMEGYAYRSSNNTIIPLPYTSTASASIVDIICLNGDIRFATLADMSAFAESYVTLYYTKSA